MKIDTKQSEFEVTISAKVNRKAVNVTTITVANLGHLGRVFDAIGDAVEKVGAEFEAEAPTEKEDAGA